MRLSLVVVSLTVCVVAQSPSHRVKHTDKSDEHQAVRTYRPKTLPPPTTYSAPITELYSYPEQYKSAEKPYDWFDGVSPQTWSNWAVVLVTLLAARIAVNTLSTVERQTRHIGDQLEEMKESSKQTDQLITVMRDNGAAASINAAAAKESSDISRIALVRGQRAIVTFSHEYSLVRVPLGDDLDSTKAFQIRIPVHNHGNTPTVDMRMHFNWHICPTIELPQDFAFADYGEHRDIPVLIAPHSKTHTAGLEISKAQIDRLKRKEAFLFLYGWARYRDVFDNTPLHQTLFCFRAEIITISKRRGGRSAMSLVLTTYNRHNEAT
jgi:hypothetical protein